MKPLQFDASVKYAREFVINLKYPIILCNKNPLYYFCLCQFNNCFISLWFIYNFLSRLCDFSIYWMENHKGLAYIFNKLKICFYEFYEFYFYYIITYYPSIYFV